MSKFTPVVLVRESDGVERTANSKSEANNLAAAGWSYKDRKPFKKATAPAKPAERPAPPTASS